MKPKYLLCDKFVSQLADVWKDAIKCTARCTQIELVILPIPASNPVACVGFAAPSAPHVPLASAHTKSLPDFELCEHSA